MDPMGNISYPKGLQYSHSRLPSARTIADKGVVEALPVFHPCGRAKEANGLGKTGKSPVFFRAPEQASWCKELYTIILMFGGYIYI